MSKTVELFKSLGYEKKLGSSLLVLTLVKSDGLQVTEISFDLLTADVSITPYVLGDWGRRKPVNISLSADEASAINKMAEEIKELNLFYKILDLRKDFELF